MKTNGHRHGAACLGDVSILEYRRIAGVNLLGAPVRILGRISRFAISCIIAIDVMTDHRLLPADTIRSAPNKLLMAMRSMAPLSLQGCTIRRVRQ